MITIRIHIENLNLKGKPLINNKITPRDARKAVVLWATKLL
jgi:hypothetical protein